MSDDITHIEIAQENAEHSVGALMFRITDLETQNAAERYEAGMYKCLYDVWEKRASKAEGQVRDLMDAMLQAIDLLTERTQGSIARSPGHNARVRLETALSALSLQHQGGK